MTYAISAQGLALIKEFEGFRAEPGQLPDGTWVVGYGHVRAEAGAPVSEAEASDLLMIDVGSVERMVNGAVTQPLTQLQFDSLVSFAFSIGAEAFLQSQVLRRVNGGDMIAAAYAMEAWRKSDVSGELEVVDALVRRRAAEKALFLADMPNKTAPSVFVRAKLDHAASILGAPVKYATAPAVGSIAVAQPRPDNVVRITEILKAEPQTETLLLTQVVANDVAEQGEDELVTAHAKPVARAVENAREALQRQAAEIEAAPAKRRRLFKGNAERVVAATPQINVDRRIRNMRRREQRWEQLRSINVERMFENMGLIALLVFGVALIATAASLLIGRPFDGVEIAGAAALAAPGLAAALMAVFGLKHTPRPQTAEAES